MMNVPEIQEVKKHLDELKEKGVIREWELPYENILTRLTAAIFFLTPTDDSKLDEIWKELNKHPMLAYRLNEEQKLSRLVWRAEFNKGFEL
ncbi:MAG: hypothetical protein KAT34_20755 [Candidatus Aminicenantes bacterium]|jgi:hypothetical protein|nr:hypothetical protein [Candidatus Aminicenantes bacterium]